MSDESDAPRRRAGGCGLLLLFLPHRWCVCDGDARCESMNLVAVADVSPAGMALGSIRGRPVLMVEGFSYRSRKPQRGDVVVFKFDKPAQELQEGIYVMRIVGLPGEKLQLTDEALLVNDQPTVLRNGAGKIHYAALQEAVYFAPGHDTVLVPEGQYFFDGRRHERLQRQPLLKIPACGKYPWQGLFLLLAFPRASAW